MRYRYKLIENSDSYSREQKVYDWLRNQGFEVYIPLHYEEVLSDGKRKRVKVPLLHNLIFIYSTRTDIDLVMKSSSNKYISYYYAHFKMDTFGKNPPLTIPKRQMDNFIRLTSIESERNYSAPPSMMRVPTALIFHKLDFRLIPNQC